MPFSLLNFHEKAEVVFLPSVLGKIVNVIVSGRVSLKIFLLANDKELFCFNRLWIGQISSYETVAL